MSKLKRLLGVLSIASLFIFSSCVDDEVSPEVTALRQAQVNLLNANTSVEAARAALIQSQVQAQTIANTFSTSINAITVANAQLKLDSATLALEVSLAQMEAAIIAAEAAAVANQVTLEVNLRNLARELATGGLSDAASYLTSWSTNVTLANAARVTVADTERDLAVAKLLLATGMVNVPQAYVVAQAEAAIVTNQMRVTRREADLALLEGFLAGNAAPDAALKAQLLALAADSVEAKAAVKALDDQITAIGGSLAEADSIIAAFEHIPSGGGTSRDGYVLTKGVLATNFVVKGNNWVTWTNNIRDANTNITKGKVDSATYSKYGQALQTIHAKYAGDVTTLNAILAPLDQAIKDAEAAQAGGGTATQDANARLTFATYYALEVALALKGTDGGTAAEISALVQARGAWDGANAADIFGDDNYTSFNGAAFAAGSRPVQNRPWRYEDLDPQYRVSFFDNTITADFKYRTINTGDNIPSFYGAMAATSSVFFDDNDPLDQTNTRGGALQALDNASLVNLGDAVTMAKNRRSAYGASYDSLIKEMGTLKTAADAFVARTRTSSAGVTLKARSASPHTANGVYDGTKYNALRTSVDSARTAYLAGGYGKVSTSTTATVNPTDGTALFASPNLGRTGISGSRTAITNNNKLLTDNAAFFAPYIVDYNAAVAFRKDAGDAIAKLRIEPQSLRFVAQELLNDIVKEMASIRAQITSANSVTLVADATAPSGFRYIGLGISTSSTGFLEYGQIKGAIDDLKAGDTNTASIAWAKLEVIKSQNALEKAKVEAVKLTTEIARLEAKLVVDKTTLAVYTSLVAKFQALVLASIGG